MTSPTMNSPWDPRYADAFYLSVNADNNYKFFKDVTDAQEFLQNTKSQGKGVVFHVLPIQTLFNVSPEEVTPTEVVAEPQSEAPEAEVVAETPVE